MGYVVSAMQPVNIYFLLMRIYLVTVGGNCRWGLTFVLIFSLTFLVMSLPLPIRESFFSLLPLRVTIAYRYKVYSNHVSNLVCHPITAYRTVPFCPDLVHGKL